MKLMNPSIRVPGNMIPHTSLMEFEVLANEFLFNKRFTNRKEETNHEKEETNHDHESDSGSAA